MSTYLGSNLLGHLLEGLPDRFHRTLSFKDDRAAGATAHVDIGLGPTGDIAEDVPQGLLQLSAWKHLGRG